MAIVSQTLIFKGDLNQPEEQFSRNNSFTFNNVAPGGTSETIVIQLSVTGTTEMGNIKLGLMDIGNVTLGTKVFGINSSNAFDPNFKIDTYFQDISDGTASSVYNISVPNFDFLNSEYVYLNIKAPRDTATGAITLRYRWFYDYVS